VGHSFKKKRFKCLSLFANVGIGETYFDQCGIDVVVANEFLPDRAEFYSEMHPQTEMICGDISDSDVFDEIILKSKSVGVDFILATPPCQGMSIAHALRANKEDPRNSLIKQAVNAIKELKPKYAIVENVSGMASEKTFILDDNDEKTNIMPYIESQLGKEYKVVYEVLDAANYETPHHRKRLITLMSRRDLPQWVHPDPSLNKITVRDAIGTFPSLECGEDSEVKWHSMLHKKPSYRHIKWMQHTPTGQTAYDNELWCPCTVEYFKVGEVEEPVYRKIKGFRSTYKRMDWDKPAPTVTMMNGSINSQNNVHPGRDNGDGTFSDARVLTIKELCAIVGLPEDWVDHLQHTKETENFLRRVLGECFPPKMAKAIVDNIPQRV